MKSPRNIILAPHVDDEVIGCFTALDRGLITDVVYFFDITKDRWDEALDSAEYFGFNAWQGDETFVALPTDLEYNLGPEDTLFIPTAKDSHIDHSRISRLGRELKLGKKCQLVFYTVDMNSFQAPLPPELRDKKKTALKKLFPSQSILLEDEKYHLFEGYTEKDHLTTVRRVKGKLIVEMTGYNPPKDFDGPQPEETDEDYLNRLVVTHYNRTNVSTIVVDRDSTKVTFNG